MPLMYTNNYLKEPLKHVYKTIPNPDAIVSSLQNHKEDHAQSSECAGKKDETNLIVGFHERAPQAHTQLTAKACWHLRSARHRHQPRQPTHDAPSSGLNTMKP